MVVAAAMAHPGALIAADPGARRATESPSPDTVDWSGLFFGANATAGGIFGRYSFSPLGLDGNRIPGFTTGFGSKRDNTSSLVGAEMGYRWQVRDVVFGLEVDGARATLKNGVPSANAPAFGFGDADFDLFRAKTDWTASVRGRLGLAFERFLVSVTAGPALANARVIGAYPSSGTGLPTLGQSEATHLGYAAGVGLEAAIGQNLSLGLEYRYTQFGSRGYGLGGLPDTGAPVFARMQFATHTTMLRLSWYPGGLAIPDALVKEEAEEGAEVGTPEQKAWSIHGQSTFIDQAVPGFHAPYSGPNSLRPRQARQSATATAFVGTRLWEGAEAYLNPEFDQGFGFNRTTGLGGFSNGEAQKAGGTYPKFHMQRYFVRETIGLGGDTEPVKDGLNQMAGTRPVDRLTITAGKFSVTDIFDDNTYSHDPRTTFLNWSIWEAGAFDYPADQLGFTRGVVLDLNRKDWALRAGYFQVPKEPNSNVLDRRFPERGGGVVELETRFSLFEQPGKLRTGVFANNGFSGSYRRAVETAAFDPGDDGTPDIARTRKARLKWGAYANLEQALTEDVGLFSRLSWNNGVSEIMSFTDIDASVSGGLSIKGKRWGRADDTIGIAGAINALSAPHRTFLAAGGLGVTVGDGRLDYAKERILEAYYAISLAKPVTLTFNYQVVQNPAYNADRGPVSIFAARLHTEF